MSNDLNSETLCTEKLEHLSKSVIRVQQLPNIGQWNDFNAILRDFIKIYFTKRSTVFRMKQNLPARKRVIVLTPDDVLLVYETNCTGYSFNIRKALRMKISTYGHNSDEKSSTITLKYKFGYINFVLVNNQISVWRGTFCAIFEEGGFSGNLLADLSLYTAKDDEIDETLLTNRSVLNYTESLISLKSARGFIDLSPSQEDNTLDVTQLDNLSLKTNSNRSSTCIPLTIRSRESLISVASRRRNNTPVDNNSNNQNMISVRQGSHAVSYLAKKFESKIKMRSNKDSKKMPDRSASPIEVLFPALPPKNREELENKGSVESLNETALAPTE